MKAVFLTEPGELELNDIPAPTCGNGMVKVRIESVGVCDDDLSAYRGQNEYQRYPIVLGRDAAGVVVETGEAKENGDPRIITFQRASVDPGARVVLLPHRIPRDHDLDVCSERCRYDRMGLLGFNVDGALREYAVLPVEQVAVLPDNVTLKEAVFVQSICKALNAVESAAPEEGDTVAIMGAGDVGIIAAQIVLAHAARPILIDPAQSRLELAKAMGVTHVVNPFASYAAEEIEWITSGDMADSVIDTAGEPAGMGSCLQFAGSGGRVVLTKKPAEKTTADLRYIIDRDLSVHSCGNTTCDVDAAMRLLLDRTVEVGSLVSATLPMEAAPLIIPSVARNPGHYMRVVLSNGSGS